MRELTSLELKALENTGMHAHVMHLLHSLPNLARLDLGDICDDQGEGDGGREGANALPMLDTLASDKLAGLRELALILPAEEVQRLDVLTSVTSLTSLNVRLRESTRSLLELTSLTGLRRLELGVVERRDPRLAAVTTLTPLTALSGLTNLDIMDLDNVSDWPADSITFVPWDLSVLSHLTALQKLRCNVYQEARFDAGDPLPVQLRFLCSATALEELMLGFCGSFWTLPPDSIRAMQRAVSSLGCLKDVRIWVDDAEPVQFFARMAVFAASSTIEILWFMTPSYALPVHPETHRMARGCFKQLRMLRNFRQAGTFAPPQFIDLLSELSSTQLTSLHLQLDSATMSLMQQIAHFSDLQELYLELHSVCLQFLEPLFVMKELKDLVMKVDEEELRVQHGAAVSAILKLASRLKVAALESARLVGTTAVVTMEGLGDP